MAGEQAQKCVGSSAAPVEVDLGCGVTGEAVAVTTGAGEDAAKQERVFQSTQPLSVIGEPRPPPQPSPPTPNPGGGTITGYPGFDATAASENREDDAHNVSYCEASIRPNTEKRAVDESGEVLLAVQIAPGARAAGLESGTDKILNNASLPNFETRKSTLDGPWSLAAPAARNSGDLVDPTNVVCSGEAPAELVIDVANKSGGQSASLSWSRKEGKPGPEHESALSLVGENKEEIELKEEGIEAGVSTVPPADPADIDATAAALDIVRSGGDMNRADSTEVTVAADKPVAKVTLVKSFVVSRRSVDGMRPDIVLSASSESGTTLEDDAGSRAAEAVGERRLSGGWAAGGCAPAGLGPLPLADSFPTDGQDSQTPRPSIIQSDGSFCSSTVGSHQTASSMTRDDNSAGCDWRINSKVGADLLGFPDTVEGSPHEREAAAAVAMVSADEGRGSAHADEQGLEGTRPGKAAKYLDTRRSTLGVRNVEKAVSPPGVEGSLRSARGSAHASVDVGTYPAEAAAAPGGQDQGVSEAAPPGAVVDRRCTSVDSAPALVTPTCTPPKPGAVETHPAHKDRYVEARIHRSTPLSGLGRAPVEGQHMSDTGFPVFVKTEPFLERNYPAESARQTAPASTCHEEAEKLEDMFPLRAGVGGPWVGADDVEGDGDDSVGITVEEAAAIMGGNPCSRFASGSSWTTTATSTAVGDAGALVPAGSPATAAKRGGLKLDDGTSFGSFADPHDFISPEPQGFDGSTGARKVTSEFFLAPMLSPGDPLRVNDASAVDVSASTGGVDGRKHSAVVSSASAAEAWIDPVMESSSVNEYGVGKGAVNTVVIAAASHPAGRADDGAMVDGGAFDPLDPLMPSSGREEGNALAQDPLFAVVRESEAEVGRVDPATSTSVPLGVTPPVTAEGRASPAQSMPVVWSAGEDAGVDAVGGGASEGDSWKAEDVANDFGQTSNPPMTGNAEVTGDLSMMEGEAERPRLGRGGCCVVS